MNIRRFALFCVASLLLLGCASTAPSTGPEPDSKTATYDLVIRNGRVLDGAGNPWILADIGIRDGRIAAVGRITVRGTDEIDATGRYVSPGWIDSMDQSGHALLSNGLAENKILMGVTTVMAGEGGTPVPAEEIVSYFETLESQGISLNFATFYSATQARVEVIGDVARPPTDDEMEQMKAKVDTAMRAGAAGVTTALIYPPSSFQTTDELVELSKISARYNGFYATHMRDEGRDILKAIDEAIEIGERSGAKVEIFHLKVGYSPGWGTLMKEAGKRIESARARGVEIAADLYPYVAGGTGLEATLPPEVFAEGIEKALANIQDTEYRENLKRRIAAKDFGEWSELNLVASAGGWKNVVLANSHNEKYAKYHGRLAAIPHRSVAFYFMMSEDDVRTALQFPWTSIGSDAAAAVNPGEVDSLGLPHPRSYGTFPRIISEYVRKTGTLTLPEAIRKMTSLPATRFGFMDRGVIREGSWADIVIFDYDTIRDTATWTDALRYPEGIDAVIVNGEIVARDGQHTGATPGHVLRGPGYER